MTPVAMQLQSPDTSTVARSASLPLVSSCGACAQPAHEVYRSKLFMSCVEYDAVNGLGSRTGTQRRVCMQGVDRIRGCLRVNRHTLCAGASNHAVI